jgi:hypothetical protein
MFYFVVVLVAWNQGRHYFIHVERILIIEGVRVYINPQTLLYFATRCGHHLVFNEL